NDVSDDFGEDVGGDGVGAEDGNGFRPTATKLADVDKPVEERQAKQREAGGKKNVGTGPEFLVDREGKVPDLASENAQNSVDGHAPGFSLRAAIGAKEFSGKHA